MSASRMPTLSPRSRRPSARLTAVVDLPTPPLPEATAMIASTPGMPAGDARRGAARRRARRRGARQLACGRRRRCSAGAGGAARALRGERHHGGFHAGHGADGASARSRTVSHCLTAPASTVMEKNTLPSVTTISESLPVAGERSAVGARDFAKRSQNVVFHRHAWSRTRFKAAADNGVLGRLPSRSIACPVDGSPPAGP